LTIKIRATLSPLLGMAIVACNVLAQQPAPLPVPTVCDQRPGGPPPCRDTNGDGLCDSWKLSQHLPGGATLPEANLDRPNVYVVYDWMGYGDEENGCRVDSDCADLWGQGGHTGETCSGPQAGNEFPKSCVYACQSDADCTSRGPSPAAHVGERCFQNRCQHTHDPEVLSPGAIQAVVDQYAARGFNLHVLRGKELPHSHVLSFRLLSDATHPVNVISDSCEGGSVASDTAGAGKYAESFYDLKQSSFNSKLALAYHYTIFAHYNTCDSPGHCDPTLGLGSTCPSPKIGVNPDGTQKVDTPLFGASGIAEIDGNDVILSLGNAINDLGSVPTLFNVGGAFMHELGHNLGLNHGGGSDATFTTLNGVVTPRTPDTEITPNFKPNYLSVMNYKFDLIGIPQGVAVGSAVLRKCSTDADCATGTHCNLHTKFCARLDYSTQTLPTGGNTPGLLDESNVYPHLGLNESAGLGSGTPDITTFSSFNAIAGTCPNSIIAPTDGPLDFDQDGNTTGTHVSVDLNRLDHSSVLGCPTGVTQVLNGHTDWGPAPGQSVFVYNFHCKPVGED
jgi:hypothetical protein